MPVRAVVRACAAAAPLLPIEHAVPVEQSQQKPFAGDARNLLQRASLVLNEAERSDRDDKVETRIGKRKVTRIAGNVNFIRGAIRPSVITPISVSIESTYT